MSHDLSKKTLIKVTVIHLIVILSFGIPIGGMIFPKKKEEVKFIEMVPLGSLKPAKGTPGPPQAAKASHTPKNSAPPVAAKSEPPPAAPAKEESKPEPPPPPKEETIPETKPKEKNAPKPWDKAKKDSKKEAKKDSQVKVSTKVITRKGEGNASSSSAKVTPKKSSGKSEGSTYQGPSEGEIKASLAKGLQSVGVESGSADGFGMPGRPDGKASWYHVLIKETFLRNWRKPQLPGAAKLETFVSIRIARDGSVTYLGIHKSSGNQAMDDSVAQAARSVSRISQPLPDDLGHPDYEVTINFRLD